MKRRWVAGGAAVVVYGVAAFFYTSETSYTVHAVRYLTLTAGAYCLLSGISLVGSYRSDGTVREDGTDFVGGVGIVVGFGVFYATVLESGVGSAGATVASLGFVALVTVFGFFAVLKL